MLFSSATFMFLFLPFSIIVYYTLLKKSRKWQNIFLFFVSILFYAWGEPSFALVMLFSIVANYLLGLLVSKNNSLKKLYLIISVIFNLSILFVFKYLGFVITSVNLLFASSITVPQIALPLGISFFTFQAMSYVIDVYRGEQVQKSLLNVGLYISFFPQLIAGPIVRYKTVAYQIQHRKESWELFYSGMCRFIEGLGKKVLLSNTMAVVADSAFDCKGELSVCYAWIGALAYTFQIFFDFGGYSDMAIGLGRMFGFEFLENFDFPYISSSITEFWRRWHMSLGSWFRDYVYFPLGGSRVESKLRLVFNLFVVWFLTGVWHGANFTFILWGLLYFVVLAIEKLTDLPKIKKFMWLKHTYTLLFVVLGWVLFRALTVAEAFTYMGAMFGATGVFVDNLAIFTLKENIVCFVLAALFSVPLLKRVVEKNKEKMWFEIIYLVFLVVVLLLCVVYMVKGTYSPFIYFNF